ncbi:hypothetical protein SAMD00023353_2501300 [Rosellinia necatrix]|uniref:Uncharacterized protein n=1 Tax=Rosellinia necatrix TaxID=77044 RepID=A0A1S8A882_ROSNE|nr:hypothetical protein SAMD00023353_2501300 [Rosellinia necatrix]
MQCLGPLQEFEARMAKYEPTLGAHVGGIGNKRGKVKAINDIRKRLHWSAIARHDVDGLRAILTSEILAINTLLTMMECMKSQNSENQMYPIQLRALARTTNDVSTEIKQYLVDCSWRRKNLKSSSCRGTSLNRNKSKS